MHWVYLDNECIPETHAKISVGDRGFLFGDGAFTTLRVNKGKPEYLQPHLERLSSHCKELNIEPLRIDPEWIQDLVRHNRASDGLWRLKIIITGGDESTLRLHSRAKGHLIMTLKPYHFYPLTPSRLCLYPHPIVSPIAHLKSLAYLDRLVVFEYAHSHSYDDAITTSCEGYVLETAFSNIFWSERDKIFVPDDSLPYLKGVFLTQLLHHLSLKIEKVKVGIEDIPADASVYTCNSLTHIRPIVEIDRRPFKRNEALETLFTEAIEKGIHQLSV